MNSENKNLIFNLGVFIPITILLGLLWQSIYYYYYNIDITQYITYGEILTLSSGNLTKVFIFYIVIYLYTFFVISKSIIYKNKRIILKYYFKNNLFDRILLFMKVYYSDLILCIFFLICAKFSKEPIELLNIAGIYFIIALWNFISIEYARKLRFYNKKGYNDTQKNRLYYFILKNIIILIFFGALGDAMANRKYSTHEYTFFINEHEVKTGNGIVYIGKTNDYIFLYDNNKYKSIIYKVESCSKIQIANSKIKRN